MKAIVIEAQGRSILSKVDPPHLGPQDLRVKVAFVGLCGSDLNTFRGLNPLVSFPRIPGHEVCGVISEVGCEVKGIAVGARVIVWPYSACGSCPSCRSGRANACQYNQTLGVQRDGALQEEIVVPHHAVMVEDSLPFPLPALVEPLSVGFHAARRGQVRAADRVLVLGCGMIGLGAIIAAAAKGAEVIAVDPIAGKERIARAMGAQHFITATGDDLLSKIKDLTSGEGASLVIEAVGLPETFRAAVELAAFCGRVVYVGYCKAPVSYDTKVFNLKELDILGSRNAQPQDFHAVIAALQQMGPAAEQLITRTIPMAEAAGALPFWQAHPNDVLKLIVAL